MTDNKSDVNGVRSEAHSEFSQHAEPFATLHDGGSEEQFARHLARAYGFSAAGAHFLISQNVLAELLEAPVYTPLPNTPNYCLGLVNVRGTIVPYFSLHNLLLGSGEEVGSIGGRYGLLLGRQSDAVMLTVSTKPTALDQQDLQANHEIERKCEPLRHCIKEAFKGHGTIWHLLDEDKLFSFLAEGRVNDQS